MMLVIIFNPINGRNFDLVRSHTSLLEATRPSTERYTATTIKPESKTVAKTCKRLPPS